MAKKSVILKNDRYGELIKKDRNKRARLLAIAKNKNLDFQERLDAQIKLSKMCRSGSKVRYRNRCSMTGRPRGYYRYFSLSRIALRDLAAWGELPGVIKSSW